MKDTSPRIERKFCEIVLERSGEERLKMGCSMHSVARALVKASISEKDPIAVNRALFLPFYGAEFKPKGALQTPVYNKGSTPRPRPELAEGSPRRPMRSGAGSGVPSGGSWGLTQDLAGDKVGTYLL